MLLHYQIFRFLTLTIFPFVRILFYPYVHLPGYPFGWVHAKSGIASIPCKKGGQVLIATIKPKNMRKGRLPRRLASPLTSIATITLCLNSSPARGSCYGASESWRRRLTFFLYFFIFFFILFFSGINRFYSAHFCFEILKYHRLHFLSICVTLISLISYHKATGNWNDILIVSIMRRGK